MKSLLLGTALLALTAGVAAAADVSPMPEAGWTGGYAGLIGGYAWGTGDLDAKLNVQGLSAAPPINGAPNILQQMSLSRSADLDGFLGGAQIGYDYEVGSGFVLGAAADFAFMGAESDKICLEGFGTQCDHHESDHAEGYAEMSWLSTVRARAGFAVGDALIYATGGLAIADVSVNVDNLNFQGDDYSDNETRTGWTIGGGAEYRITQNVSIGAEYLYVDLGSVDTNYNTGVGPYPAKIKAETAITTNVVRASLNYRF